ncbi:PEP-CTERM sorting domain-containing protein [Paludisphaera rhizosphaerae]|uniref:PEP-CTERM sorting domain-containing protein n=1 Tax=Paludisphaera rhizosphaerae TaxID=2711216 RepID=UPI0013EA775E|nr:PEP-CTERM sorting domain-containing protein [Paludisphaera rhizosphaerae]
MKRFTLINSLILLATVGQAEQAAADVVYQFSIGLNNASTLPGVPASSAGTASGTFTYSDDLQRLLSISMSTSSAIINGSSMFFSGNYYVPSVADDHYFSVTYAQGSFSLFASGGQFLTAEFTPISSGSGSIIITESQYGNRRSGSGTLLTRSSEAAPEPSSIVLIALGAPAAFAVVRRSHPAQPAA